MVESHKSHVRVRVGIGIGLVGLCISPQPTRAATRTPTDPGPRPSPTRNRLANHKGRAAAADPQAPPCDAYLRRIPPTHTSDANLE